MSNKFFGAISHIGGTDGDLDKISKDIISDGDGAVVIDAANNTIDIYTLDSSSSEAEDSTNFTVIKPDDEAADPGKRWLKVYDVNSRSLAAEWSAQQNFNESAITDDGTGPPGDTAWNLDTAQCAIHTLTANTEISAPTNMNAGGSYVLRVVQAAGLFTLAWNAVFKWGDAATPIAPAANGDVVVFSFYSDGTSLYGAEMNRTEA